MQSPYDAIADVYDLFVQTDLDIPFFLEEARRADGEILELMAGTGRVSLPLIEAGARLTCVDRSAEMLDVLRRKLDRASLSADLHAADVVDLSLGKRFAQVIIPFHAFPEITDREDQARALERIHAHLAEGGRFICTLHNPPVRLRGVDDQLRLAADRPAADPGARLLVWAHQSRDADGLVTIREFFEEYDAQGALASKRLATLRFRLLEKAVFEGLFRAAGFEPVELYGDYSRSAFDEQTSPFMIWVLKRAG